MARAPWGKHHGRPRSEQRNGSNGQSGTRNHNTESPGDRYVRFVFRFDVRIPRTMAPSVISREINLRRRVSKRRRRIPCGCQPNLGLHLAEKHEHSGKYPVELYSHHGPVTPPANNPTTNSALELGNYPSTVAPDCTGYNPHRQRRLDIATLAEARRPVVKSRELNAAESTMAKAACGARRTPGSRPLLKNEVGPLFLEQ